VQANFQSSPGINTPTGRPARGQPRAFQPIPTRIQGVPELIVDPGSLGVRDAINENLTELGARLAVIHLMAAEAYLSQGQYVEAVPHLEAAVSMDYANLDNLNQLGYVRYLAGDDAGAVRVLDSVLAVDPNNPDALFNVGMISFGAEDLVRAEQCFRACSQQDAANPEVWNNLGVTLFKVGKLVEARACFQRTLELEPGNEDARFNLQNIG
jgi:Flp pilus assembly protein TadD